MLAQSVLELERMLPSHALVLDVGAWGRPFRRADWVLDYMPYETRGLYGFDGQNEERFDAKTWVVRDMCAREPWPFEDGQFDFVICSHTLEDVRDPVWVCHELMRVAKAGYIEVPSRLEEQTFHIQGPWVGWGHHHWLVDIANNTVEFAFKHHILQGKPETQFPAGFADPLTPEQRVQRFQWTGGFEVRERTFLNPDDLDSYLADFVKAHGGHRPAPAAPAVRRWSRKR
jgi:hypothetical protein